MNPFYLGLDLGQRADYSALAILEYHPGTTSRRDPTTWQPVAFPTLRLVSLSRLPLGTSYTAVASWLRHHLHHPALNGHATLAVDASGPGLPFLDFLTANPLPANLLKIVITASGDPHYSRGLLHVSRTALLSNLAILFQNRTLTFPQSLPEAPRLLAELTAIRAASLRSSTHDDLVMALTLAAWQPSRSWRRQLLSESCRPHFGPAV